MVLVFSKKEVDRKCFVFANGTFFLLDCDVPSFADCFYSQSPRVAGLAVSGSDDGLSSY